MKKEKAPMNAIEAEAAAPVAATEKRSLSSMIALAIDALAVFLIAATFFAKWYVESADDIGSYLKDVFRYSDDLILLIGFLVAAIAATVSLILLGRAIAKFVAIRKDGKSAFDTVSRRLVRFSAFYTGAFFLSGAVITFIKLGIVYGSDMGTGVLFLLAGALLIAQGFFTGESRKPASAPGIDRRERKLITKRVIGIIGISLFTALVIVSFIPDLFRLEYDSSLGFENVSISGVKLLQDYRTMDKTMQILAYLFFTMGVTSVSLMIISLAAFSGGSKSFGRLGISTVLTDASFVFFIGMFGKYYEIAQKINETQFNSILESLGLPRIEIGGAYKVTSPVFYLVPAAVLLMTLIVALKPFTYVSFVSINADGVAAGTDNAAVTSGNAARNTEIVGAGSAGEPKKSKGSAPALPEIAGGSAVGTQAGEAKEPDLRNFDNCPVFTEIDSMRPQFDRQLKERLQARAEGCTLPSLVKYIVDYARESRLRLSYTKEDIATFVAGLGATRLTILQGMSGTGKTSLPKIFAETLMGNCELVEVESAWKDKNELLGYYNEFSKTYTPKKFTQALYRAVLNPDVITLIVLDEMNLSRIEYYFSDFLSLMENEEGKREIRLANVKLSNTVEGEKIGYAALTNGHTIRIPGNVWFIGTANRDESTFEISDKVYDRANTMNFDRRAAKAHPQMESPLPPVFVGCGQFRELLSSALSDYPFSIEDSEIVQKVEQLLLPYNISFGNRIANQIESFVKIYCSCLPDKPGVVSDAVEKILLSKVVRKLETKTITNREELARSFEKLKLFECSEFIRHLNEDSIYD